MDNALKLINDQYELGKRQEHKMNTTLKGEWDK